MTQRTEPAQPALGRDDFDELFRRCARDVHAYAISLLRDRAAAEDVTAVAFERLFRSRGRLDARRGTPRALLFAIARNAALDELRRRRRQPRAELEMLTELDAALRGDASGEAADAWRQLSADVRALAPPPEPDFERELARRLAAGAAESHERARRAGVERERAGDSRRRWRKWTRPAASRARAVTATLRGRTPARSRSSLRAKAASCSARRCERALA